MSKRAMIVPVLTLCVAAVLFFTINGCWTRWEGGGAEQRTDDAYVRADLTPLSTRISGTVRKMEVGDDQAVKAGQLLVQLGGRRLWRDAGRSQGSAGRRAGTARKQPGSQADSGRRRSRVRSPA